MSSLMDKSHDMRNGRPATLKHGLGEQQHCGARSGSQLRYRAEAMRRVLHSSLLRVAEAAVTPGTVPPATVAPWPLQESTGQCSVPWRQRVRCGSGRCRRGRSAVPVRMRPRNPGFAVRVVLHRTGRRILDGGIADAHSLESPPIAVERPQSGLALYAEHGLQHDMQTPAMRPAFSLAERGSGVRSSQVSRWIR